jgi:hypothetical protein
MFYIEQKQRNLWRLRVKNSCWENASLRFSQSPFIIVHNAITNTLHARHTYINYRRRCWLQWSVECICELHAYKGDYSRESALISAQWPLCICKHAIPRLSPPLKSMGSVMWYDEDIILQNRKQSESAANLWVDKIALYCVLLSFWNRNIFQFAHSPFHLFISLINFCGLKLSHQKTSRTVYREIEKDFIESGWNWENFRNASCFWSSYGVRY